MANVFRQITLNSKGQNAGPYFDVYYSLDCSEYILAVDGASTYLPSVGSNAIVTIPNNTQCLKLVNLSDVCGFNSEIENITLTTTTTTTSTTTSTTTTQAPTTTTTSTTTTVAPKYWNANYCSTGTAAPFPLKVPGNYTAGQVVSAVVADTTYCYTLTTEYVGTPFVYYTATQFYVSCAACGVTTTTTTTSTTTTQPPVWYNLYNCSNGQIETSAQYPAGTFSVNQRVVYGGALYFYVVSSTSSNPGGIQWSVTSAGSGLTGCPATTTTTTTTTLAPVRLSLTGSCSGNNNVLLANNFRGGNGTYVSVASGSSESNAFSAQQISLGGASSYTFNGLPNGMWYVVLRDSLGNAGYTSASLQCNTTTTTTSTTTTTVAPPPFSFLTNTGRNGSTAACNASKTIYLWAYSDTWDNGITYYEGTISGPTLPLSTYPGANQWFANGGVALQIDDNGLSSNATACPTTTTTTTTIAPTKYTYLLYDINPTTCATTGTPTPIWSYLSFSNGYYKIESDPTTYYLEVSAHTDYTLQFLSATSATCTPVTTTTTTTTTLAPVYYQILSCVDSSTAYSIQYPAGTYNSGDRVITNTSVTCVVIGSTTTLPGGTLYTLSSTGQFGCPSTTTTTTTTLPPVDFTYTTSCSGGLGTITITGITGGTGTGYQFSIQPTPGIWYNYPANTQLTGLASGFYYSVAVRDSAGAGTNKAIFISCATTTSTTTTTTTAAPTTTTTTTPPGTAYVYITNQMFGGTITDVTVNGVSISGASFPLAIGDSTSGITTQTGTNETMRVYYSGATPSPQYIQVTDTALNQFCQLAAGTSNRLYTNLIISNGQTVDVFCGDGNCP